MKQPIVLMYGLGCDGVTVLHEWITNPSSRDFDLEDLIVLTAQTGLEWRHTAYLNETYLYPMLREHSIRTVQIAKGGPSVRDGFVVLDDTRSPTKCFIRGKYTLSYELLLAATLPQYSESRRQCSPKHKGIPLEQWLDHEFGLTLGEGMLHNGSVPQYSGDTRICSDHYKIETLTQWMNEGLWSLGDDLIAVGSAPHFHPSYRKCSDKFKQVPCNQWLDAEGLPEVRVAIGFNADESYRIQRAEFAHAKKRRLPTGFKRVDFYPLMEWGMKREDTVARGRVVGQGEDWWRSACTICPFSGIAGPNEEVLFKHRLYPDESAFALFIEHVARRLNPTQTLYPGGRSLYAMIEADGNHPAIEHFNRLLNAVEWGVYRVRRVYAAVPWRHTKILEVGCYSETDRLLRKWAKKFGGTIDASPDGIPRCHLERRSDGFDCVDLLVCAPSFVVEKSRKNFLNVWLNAHQMRFPI